MELPACAFARSNEIIDAFWLAFTAQEGRLSHRRFYVAPTNIKRRTPVLVGAVSKARGRGIFALAAADVSATGN
jgi:hypothetical protein